MTTFIPQIEKLSSCVTRILGCNPGHMTLQGTNTYLVGRNNRKILIDAGEENNSEYVSLLQSVLKTNKWTVSDIIITHWHQDHIGGVPSVLKHVEETSSAKVHKFPTLELAEAYAGIESLNFIKDKQTFSAEGVTLQAIHTPGHTVDHIILEMKEEGIVFSGDNVLGEGTTVMEDLYNYMKSLQTILDLKPSIIYPGHGPVISDPIPFVQNYIQHRLAREQQILECLKERHPQKSMVKDIREKVYKNLANSLHIPAEKNITLHLEKLLKENKVCVTDEIQGKMWLCLSDDAKL
ncbi:endoribonuclease LACTB2-like [Argonauta hians]